MTTVTTNIQQREFQYCESKACPISSPLLSRPRAAPTDRKRLSPPPRPHRRSSLAPVHPKQNTTCNIQTCKRFVCRQGLWGATVQTCKHVSLLPPTRSIWGTSRVLGRTLLYIWWKFKFTVDSGFLQECSEQSLIKKKKKKWLTRSLSLIHI